MMELHIEKTLKIDVALSDEDYPDQFAEVRLEAIEKALLEFIYRVVGANTVSVEEDRSARMAIAMKLLDSFQSDCNSNLLRSRLGARLHGLNATELPNLGFAELPKNQ